MKKFQIFLAYYTLIASMGLFAWSMLWGPRPQSYLITLAVIPTGIYFWLILTSNHDNTAVDEEMHVKLPLAILATLFVSMVSIFVYSTANAKFFAAQSTSFQSVSKEVRDLRQQLEKNDNAQLKGQIDKISSDLALIRKDIANSKSVNSGATNNAVLGDTSSSAGFVTISDSKNASINVYETKSLSAKIIGKAIFGKTYTFIEKSDSWYLIMLSDVTKSASDQKMGYIEKQFVKEVAY